MKIDEVGIGNIGPFSHKLPKGTQILGVLNPLTQKIAVGVPDDTGENTEEYKFVVCQTGDSAPDDAKYLGSTGCGTKHVFFLGEGRE